MTRDEMMKMLAEEYGIHSEQELLHAISKMEQLDIGIFTTGKEKSTSEESDMDEAPSVFEDIKTGLEQAIEYNKGNCNARETILTVPPRKDEQK